jgi:hypothetical protein
LTDPHTFECERHAPRQPRALAALLAFAASLGLALSVPASAESPFVFSPPMQLAGPNAHIADVAVDGSGRTTIVWHEYTTDGKSALIQTARLGADGVLGPARTLAMTSRGIPACCASVVVDSLGRATVAWLESDAVTHWVEAVQLGADGAPVGPVRTLSPAGEDAGAPVLAVDSLGRVTVVWQMGESSRRIESVRLLPDGASDAPQTLSEPGVDSLAPRLAIDPQDRIAVAWKSTNGLQLVRLGSDGSPGSVKTVLSPEAGASPGRMVIDSHGRVTFSLWESRQGKAIHVDLDGTVGAVLTLSGADEEIWDAPLLAVDHQDRVAAVWGTLSHEIKAAQIEADGTVGPTRPVSDPARNAAVPSVAIGPGGRPVVAWGHPIVGRGLFVPTPEECEEEDEGSGFDPASDVIQASFIGEDGVPGPILSVSEQGEQSLSPFLGAGPNGVVVVWRDYEGVLGCPDLEENLLLSRGPWPPPEPGPEMLPPLPAPPEVTPPAVDAIGTLRLARRAHLGQQRLLLRAFCLGQDGAVCNGRIRLVAPEKGILASGPFRFGVGKRRLRLPLSRQGHLLLLQKDRQSVRARVEGHGAKRGTVVIAGLP